jgi:hypothetical protein
MKTRFTRASFVAFFFAASSFTSFTAIAEDEKMEGTIAARCDKEENNLLALNLAYDVITGKKSVEEARKAYGEMIKMAMSGNKPEYMKKLIFSSNMSAPDSDMNTIGAM